MITNNQNPLELKTKEEKDRFRENMSSLMKHMERTPFPSCYTKNDKGSAEMDEWKARSGAMLSSLLSELKKKDVKVENKGFFSKTIFKLKCFFSNR